MTSETLTVYDVARYCGVSQFTVLKWVNQGRLGAIKTPKGQLLIPRDEFRAFVRVEGWPADERYFTAGGKAKKVLVVSDDDEITQIIARSLRHRGAVPEVFSAGDSHEAECQIISLQPDLVVLRWMAPRVNSDGICRWLKLNPAFEDTRVLAIAQEDSLRHLERILAAGADDVTWEPLDSDTVQRKLCTLLMSTPNARAASTGSPPTRERH